MIGYPGIGLLEDWVVMDWVVRDCVVKGLGS